MFSTSSLKKSVNFSLLLVGAFASLLAAPLLSTTTQRVESPAMPLSISSPTTLETSQPGDSSAIFLGLAVVGGSAAAIILSTKKVSRSPSTQSQETAIRLEQASPVLQKKLLRLVHNDLGTASRLITLAKVKHPNRSANWYVEKAIYDLERDRGRY